MCDAKGLRTIEKNVDLCTWEVVLGCQVSIIGSKGDCDDCGCYTRLGVPRLWYESTILGLPYKARGTQYTIQVYHTRLGVPSIWYKSTILGQVCIVYYRSLPYKARGTQSTIEVYHIGQGHPVYDTSLPYKVRGAQYTIEVYHTRPGLSSLL